MRKFLTLFAALVFSLFSVVSFAQDAAPAADQAKGAMMAPKPADTQDMDAMMKDMMMSRNMMMTKHMMMMSMKMRMVGEMMSTSKDQATADKGKKMVNMSMQMYMMAKDMMADNNMGMKDMTDNKMMDGCMMQQ